MNLRIEKRGQTFGKGDLMLLAQLLHTMKESVEELEKYYKKKDVENVNAAKKEILDLQAKIDQILR